MKTKTRKLNRGFNQFRLMLTLGLAVLLPAVALIIINFVQLRSFERNKLLEAALHRDFQEYLTLAEKRLNKQMYGLVEDLRERFPSPDLDSAAKERELDSILAANPAFAHVWMSDEKGFTFRSQSNQAEGRYVHEEHERLVEMYRGWINQEGKQLAEEIHKKSRQMRFDPISTRRGSGDAYMTSAMFVLPKLSSERVVLAGAVLDPCYLQSSFFPGTLEELATGKLADQGGNPMAMMVYHVDPDSSHDPAPLAASKGWAEGKPEVMRKLDDVFRGFALGIRFQGTSIQAMGESWVNHNFLLLGIVSLLIIGGLVLTRHVVSKEMALARLKSDFVSNVSHELRTPLALIRLYAETLELGRITTPNKKQQYYRIIRKESERLTALINNILDFSRIEAGRKEYEMRETDIAELVHNTLDSYRYQIEQQGFALEESIATDLPPVQVDREAIARALVNLVNNALKYSADEKFLRVKLYRDYSVLKLEVVDHGIGIARRDQAKIFEKFYRTCDPLVHNTKGSGLGLSLVRHITQAHGGDVEVESTPGKGSKFTLMLPVTASAATANQTM